MRSSYAWEAILVCVLIVVAAAAMSAWTIARARGKKPDSTVIEEKPSNAAVAVAIKAIEKFAPFYLQMGAAQVSIDSQSIEAPEPTVKGPRQSWQITGQGSADYVDGQTFHWVVFVDENLGEMTLREVRINGDVVFEGAERVETPAP